MAAGQDYLSLVNTLARRFNEVELTSANFATARGFHAQMKDAINAAIREINSDGAEWPFNWITLDLALTPGQNRYAFPVDAKVIDAESFRLLRDPAVNIGSSMHLQTLTYDDWLERYGFEEAAATGSYGSPERMALGRNQAFIISPPPDQAYTVRYEYYSQPVELVAATDETNIPLPYRFVIVDRASVDCHVFRTDMEAAGALRAQYQSGIKDMRKNLVNRNDYMRSTLSGV